VRPSRPQIVARYEHCRGGRARLYFGYPKLGRPVITKIEKWGNSQGIRLTRPTLAEMGLAAGDAVDIHVQDGVLTVKPARRVKGGHDLAELVARIPRDYEPEEVDWGAPRGREVW